MTLSSLLFVLLAACSSSEAPSPAADPAATQPAPAPPPAAPAADHASGEHAHTSSHGGIVEPVGDGHVEALMMPTGILFYLTDAAEKPIPVEGYTGTAVVKGPAGVSTVPLIAMGDHLHASTTLTQGQPASVVVTLTKDGKAVSASFETGSVGLPSHDHTSLHGGQVGMWGEHHLEYAPKDGVYRIWITDEHRNPVTTGVTVSLKDGATTVPLAFDAASGMFSGPGAGAGTRPVMVDVKMGEKSFSLAFNAVGGAAASPAAGSQAAPAAGGPDHAKHGDGHGHH